MNTKTLTLLLLTLPIYLIGQNNSSIDFIGGIEYSFRTISPPADDGISEYFYDLRKRETKKLNWRVGLNYNHKLTKKIHVKTGIRLASVGYKGENRTGFISTEPVGGVINYDPISILEIQEIYDYLFVEVPVIGRIEFSNKKINPFLELGISPNIHLMTRTKIITKTTTDVNKEVDYESNERSDFNKLQLVGSISFGLNYQMREKLQLFGQPIFRYHLTKVADASIEEHLYNYGIELGLRRMLD